MGRIDELPPTYEPDIREHCKNAKSELVLNALTVPQVGFIVCRGCGARLEMSGFTGARSLSERLVEDWNAIVEAKNRRNKPLGL